MIDLLRDEVLQLVDVSPLGIFGPWIFFSHVFDFRSLTLVLAWPSSLNGLMDSETNYVETEASTEETPSARKSATNFDGTVPDASLSGRTCPKSKLDYDAILGWR